MRYRNYTITVTSSATNATTMVIADGDWHSITNCNWVSTEDPPKVPPEYLKLRPVALYRDCQRAQMVSGKVEAPLARGKLTRWKSLKEKRQSWGLS